jgi:hypothetical protein
MLSLMQQVADSSDGNARLGEDSSAAIERAQVTPVAQSLMGDAAAARLLIGDTRHHSGAAPPSTAAATVERPAAVVPAAPAPAFRLEEEGGTGGLAMPGQSNPLAQAVLLSRMVVPEQAASRSPQEPVHPGAAAAMGAGGADTTGPRAVEAPTGGSSWRDRMAARLAAKK